jgi:hypothetical protein
MTAAMAYDARRAFEGANASSPETNSSKLLERRRATSIGSSAASAPILLLASAPANRARSRLGCVLCSGCPPVRGEQPGFEHRYRHVDLDVILEPVATEDLHELPLLKLDFFTDLGICIEEQEDLCVTGFQELSRLEERRRKGSLATDPHDAHTYPRTQDAGDQRLDECLVRITLYEKGELDRRYGFRSSHRLYA